jgi:hypothetical protein
MMVVAVCVFSRPTQVHRSVRAGLSQPSFRLEENMKPEGPMADLSQLVQTKRATVSANILTDGEQGSASNSCSSDLENTPTRDAFTVLGVVSAVITILLFMGACFGRGRDFLRSIYLRLPHLNARSRSDDVELDPLSTPTLLRSPSLPPRNPGYV